jgi:radical SAM superfamily enzyme YgiQ (UPF0313 family)
MIIQKKSLQEVIEICRSAQKPIALGGPYATSSHDKISGVDYFILNEGEITLPEFIRDYEMGVPKKIYQTTLKPDITQSPLPRFDLLNIKAYSKMSLQLSRGCPFNCEFCDIIEMFGRSPRYKEPTQFMIELDAVFNAGYRGPLFIVDDNFIGNKKKVKEMLHWIHNWQSKKKYPFSFFTESSINLAQDDELMDLMVQSGFDLVFIGIETTDEAILLSTDKKQNTRHDLKTSIEKIQKKGMEVMAGFIIGFDNEAPDIFEKQISFIQNSHVPLAMVGMLTALPETRLYRRLEKEGRILNDTEGNNTHVLETNFIPTMDPEKLKDGYKKIISELYSPKNYFKRSLGLLKNIAHNKYSRKLTLREKIRPLLHSLIKQTFSNYGLHYVLFLIKSIWHDFRKFPEAVTYAVKGYHFFKITNHILTMDKFSEILNNALRTLEEKAAYIFQKKPEAAMETIQFILKRNKKRILRYFHKLEDDLKKELYIKYLEFDKKAQQLVSKYSQGMNA